MGPSRLAVLLLLLLRPLPAQDVPLAAPLAELERRARVDSNDALAQFDVGLAYWTRGRLDEAERGLRLAVALDPRLACAYLALAELPYARRPSLREELARDRVPDGWRPAILEAEQFERRAFLLDPLIDFRLVAPVRRRAPQQVNVHVGPGAAYVVSMPFDDFRLGRYQAAFQMLDGMVRAATRHEAMDSVPDYLLWFHGLAAAHTWRHPQAVRDFETLLARTESRARVSLVLVPLAGNDFRYLLALLRERTGDREAAIRMYRDALVNDVGLYMAHVRLAGLFRAAGYPFAAQSELRQAVLANPDDSSLLLELGGSLTETGDLAAALDTLRLAQSLNPRDARVPLMLGIVEERLGHVAPARSAYLQFLALAPARLSPQIAYARARMDSLQETAR